MADENNGGMSGFRKFINLAAGMFFVVVFLSWGVDHLSRKYGGGRASRPAASRIRGTQCGMLSALRSELRDYKVSRGSYPVSLAELPHPVPKLWSKPDNPGAAFSDGLFPHPSSDEVVYYSSVTAGDTGKWAYVNDPSCPEFGTVFIDCTHQDGGIPWSSF